MIHEILKILDTTDLQELEKQRITTDLLRLFNVVGQSEQFKCDCGCTNHYKNEMYDSVKCADCGTVYARI